MASTPLAALTTPPGDTKSAKSARPTPAPGGGRLFETLFRMLREEAGETETVATVPNDPGETKESPEATDLSRLKEKSLKTKGRPRGLSPAIETPGDALDEATPAKEAKEAAPTPQKTPATAPNIAPAVSIETLLRQIAKPEKTPADTENAKGEENLPAPRVRTSDATSEAEAARTWLIRKESSLRTGDRYQSSLRTVADLRRAKDLGALEKEAEKAGLNPRLFRYEKIGAKRPAPNAAKTKQSEEIPRFFTQQERYVSPATASVIETLQRKKEGAKPSLPKETKEPLQPLRALLNTPEPDAAPADAKESAREQTPLKDLMRTLSATRNRSDRHETPAPVRTEATGAPPPEAAGDIRDKAPERAGGDELPEPFHLHKGEGHENLHNKIAEAKQTVRHFARTLQEQVENYKPPFSRMQLSLDPKELGSVEVTMVSRGNNLHIQVHSNPTAIGVMATQGQELKNQLVSMGFTDVQMQFNMNQQQQQQNRHAFGRSGGYGEGEEPAEFYESLDLIIPQYV